MHRVDSLDEPFSPDIVLNHSSDVPLYRQIADPLADQILSGELEPGQLLEDEVTLANRLNVSRPTARRALQELVQKGLLRRRRGAGTRVTFNHARQQIGLTSFKEDFIKAGHDVTTQVLNYSLHLADADTAEKLGCEEGEEVVVIFRLRCLDGNPLVIMKNTIPKNYAPSLSEISNYGLYESFEKNGLAIASALQVVGAKVADEEEAELLGMEPGSALLTMTRTTYTSFGDVVDYGWHCYDADQYQLTIPLSADV